MQPKTYKIYYNLGECSTAVIEAIEQDVQYNSNYEVYIPYCEDATVYDYEFVKWVRADTNEAFENGKWEYTDNIYLTAVWEKFTPDF